MLRSSCFLFASCAVGDALLCACAPSAAVADATAHTSVTIPAYPGSREHTQVGPTAASASDTDVLGGTASASGASSPTSGSVFATTAVPPGNGFYNPYDEADASTSLYIPQTAELRYVLSVSSVGNGYTVPQVYFGVAGSLPIDGLGLGTVHATGSKQATLLVGGPATYVLGAIVQTDGTVLDTGTKYGVASGVWGIGYLPGANKQHPLQTTTMQGGILIGNPPADDPYAHYEHGEPSAHVAGVNLVAPVVDGYGRTVPIFATVANAAASAASLVSKPGLASATNPLLLDFYEQVGGPNFTSFIIPDPLSNGEWSYTISFAGLTELVNTGDIVDFTAIVPGGIDNFQLSGFGPGFSPYSSDAPPLVWGATYSQNGVAEVNIASLPEPSTLFLAIVGLVGAFAAARRRRGRA